MDRQEQESAAANSFIHAWTAFFERQRDNRDPPVNNNASGQQQWWSALGRTRCKCRHGSCSWRPREAAASGRRGASSPRHRAPRRERGDASQGCSYLPQPKEEPNDEEEKYIAAA
jgi:hypothetical protein